MSPEHLDKLKSIETNGPDDYRFGALAANDQKQAREVYPHIYSHLTGRAAKAVLSVEDGNGFEAWKALCRIGLIRSSDAALHLVQHPVFDQGSDPREKCKSGCGQ